MFTRLGGPELLILLVVVILLFGAGRITKVAKELGSGIRLFKEGLGESEKQDKE
jgi:sec-independent protein translocase protein TatA